MIPILKLKSGVDRRLRAGHRWVFSNEVAVPLKEFRPGEIVEVRDSNDYTVGTGYVNPHALICVRLLTDRAASIDHAFLHDRIVEAAAKRARWMAGETCFRLVFGESDGLPGIVIDRYDHHLVVQSHTAGGDRLTTALMEVLQKLYSPESIVLRQDSSSRKLENLPQLTSVAYGSCPPRVDVTIHGLRYRLDLLNGQKTGFFLDQRENHLLMQSYAGQRSVLDCFTHLGAWALQAAKSGASKVHGLDSSRAAVDECIGNADINGLAGCTFEVADVFDALKAYNERQERFDLIVLDPPAFAKSKSQVKDAVKGYREINRRAAKALSAGGVLITCSCSHVIDSETFRNTVLQGITAAGRNALLIDQRGQARDHPILLSMRETEYLKCLVLEII